MIAKLFPDGVICMNTALFFYGYSNRTPMAWDIAINKNTSKNITRFLEYAEQRRVLKKVKDDWSMAVMEMGESVLAKLRNKTQKSGMPFQLYLQLFCQEEFLRRLSLSKYADNLVLKGGLFIYTLTNFGRK